MTFSATLKSVSYCREDWGPTLHCPPPPPTPHLEACSLGHGYLVFIDSYLPLLLHVCTQMKSGEQKYPNKFISIANHTCKENSLIQNKSFSWKSYNVQLYQERNIRCIRVYSHGDTSQNSYKWQTVWVISDMVSFHSNRYAETLNNTCSVYIVSEWVSVGGFMPCRQLGSYSWRKQVWTYSVLVENKFGLFQVLGDRIYEMRCLFAAVGLNARFIVLPHWDNMS